MRAVKMNKKTVAILSAGLIVATAGGAYAYWTTSGSGTGSATTGTSTAVTLDQIGSITALTPGSPAQAVDFSITNPGTTNQYIASVAVSMTVTPGSIAGQPPCTNADFTLVQPTASYGDLTPGLHNYSPSGASLALKNTALNQDNCKTATVSLTFNAS